MFKLFEIIVGEKSSARFEKNLDGEESVPLLMVKSILLDLLEVNSSLYTNFSADFASRNRLEWG